MQRLKTCFSLASNDIKWFEVDRRFSHDCQRPWAVGSLPREVVLDMLWSHMVESLTVDGKDFVHPLVKQGKILPCFFLNPWSVTWDWNESALDDSKMCFPCRFSFFKVALHPGMLHPARFVVVGLVPRPPLLNPGNISHPKLLRNIFWKKTKRCGGRMESRTFRLSQPAR